MDGVTAVAEELVPAVARALPVDANRVGLWRCERVHTGHPQLRDLPLQRTDGSPVPLIGRPSVSRVERRWVLEGSSVSAACSLWQDQNSTRLRRPRPTVGRQGHRRHVPALDGRVARGRDEAVPS